jgi:hypothetical protein
MNQHIRLNTTCLAPPPFIEVLVYIISYFVLFDIVFEELFRQCGISFFILIVIQLDIFVIICT